MAYESSILFIIDDVYVNFWELSLNFVLYAGIFYLNSLVILPRLLKKKKYVLLVVNLLLVIALVIPIKYCLYLYVLPHLDSNLLYPYEDAKMFIAQTVWRGGYFAMLSTGYFFAKHAIRNEREKRRLAEARRRRERYLRKVQKELMDMEMNNLRNQINPHFLFNTLNYFYTHAYLNSGNVAQGIQLLADIMRYGLREEEINGKMLLENEVQHLRNYIAINQLRFNNQLQVRLEVSSGLAYKLIIPLVLITFVENCFKHGDLTDPASMAVIKVNVEENTLLFSTFNKKKTGFKEKSAGIGLLNTRRRLELTYKNKYLLESKDEESFYTCKLTLKL
jgi:sensor histidine kinase YesM